MAYFSLIDASLNLNSIPLRLFDHVPDEIHTECFDLEKKLTLKEEVQRSVEDECIVVATYEGEHNHPIPSPHEVTSGSNHGPAAAPLDSSAAAPPCSMTLDLTKSKSSGEGKALVPRMMVKQMASSLIKDPNFTAALAAAISGLIQ